MFLFSTSPAECAEVKNDFVSSLRRASLMQHDSFTFYRLPFLLF